MNPDSGGTNILHRNKRRKKQGESDQFKIEFVKADQPNILNLLL